MEKIIVEALFFAAHKHRHQQRVYQDQAPIPYLNHPIDVMHILAIEAGITDTNILVAALLHDTIEDTETTIEELIEKFGKDITNLVLELSDDQDLPREVRYALQLEKTHTYSDEAKLVKLADRIANLRDMILSPMPGWSEERRFGHFRQARAQVDILGDAHQRLVEIFNIEYEIAAKLMQI